MQAMPMELFELKPDIQKEMQYYIPIQEKAHLPVCRVVPEGVLE
jgi:hypothetical protein